MSRFIKSKVLWCALWECGCVAHFDSAVLVSEMRAKSFSHDATSYGRFRDFWEESTNFISHVARGYVKKSGCIKGGDFLRGYVRKLCCSIYGDYFSGVLQIDLSP